VAIHIYRRGAEFAERFPEFLLNVLCVFAVSSLRIDAVGKTK